MPRPYSAPHEYTDVPARARPLLEAALARGKTLEATDPGPGEYALVSPRREDADGDREVLGETEVVHRFVEAPGDSDTVRWHYVEAGAGEPVVFLHGIPESWYMWHRQLDALGPDHHVLAVDLKGYGQSDKRTGDYRQEGVGEQLMAMLDTIGIDEFTIVAHDRGAVIADYMAANHPERVLRYIRGEQHLYHLNPDLHPQEKLFTDPERSRIMARPAEFLRVLYAMLVEHPVDGADARRTVQEFSYAGIDRAVPRYFHSSSFRKEWIDRRERLMAAWDFPVLLLQGYHDPWQPREYYEDAHEHLPDVTVRFIEAGHYYVFERPQETTDAICEFLAGHPR
jgi:pimeloyl-ACP methyl ester carboxylesterase